MCQLEAFVSSHLYPFYRNTWLEFSNLVVRLRKCHIIINNTVQTTIVINNVAVDGAKGRGVFKRFYRKLRSLVLHYGFDCIMFERVINFRLENRLLRQGYMPIGCPLRGNYYLLLHRGTI
jgi:hypothetical protein